MAGIQAHLSAPHQLPPLDLDQEEKLEANFLCNRNPSDLEVMIIAAEVDLPEDTVKVSECLLLKDACGRVVTVDIFVLCATMLPYLSAAVTPFSRPPRWPSG